MHSSDTAWKRLHDLCDELQTRGWTAIPCRETHSCVIRGTKKTRIGSGDTEAWEETPLFAEIFVSDEDLLHEDYKEIVLRKMTAAVGHLRVH